MTVLVNNAAVVHGKSLMDSDDDSLLKSQHVNTLGQFWVRAAGACVQGNPPGGFSYPDYSAGRLRAVGRDRYYGRLNGVFPKHCHM